MIPKGMIVSPFERFWIRIPAIDKALSIVETTNNVLPPPQLEEIKQNEQVLVQTLPEQDWRKDKPSILELVDPFLHCFVSDITLNKLPANYNFENPCQKHQLKDPEYSDTFQLLPTEFYCDPVSKEVTTRSYINNLDPRHYKDTYKSIEQVVAAAIPQFEKVLSKLVTMDVSNEAKVIDLSGRPLQIIVGMKSYYLTPKEKSKYEGGSWHIEGLKNERIVASAIYYYDVENITVSQLAFRVQVNDRKQYTELGYSTADSNRLVVFPNIYEHMVRPFELADKSKPGHRKFLTLFLVDPSTKILSTAEVAPQQEGWYPITGEHSCDLLQGQGGEYSTSATMSLKDAKAYRNKASAQRGVKNVAKETKSSPHSKRQRQISSSNHNTNHRRPRRSGGDASRRRD